MRLEREVGRATVTAGTRFLWAFLATLTIGVWLLIIMIAAGALWL